MREISTCRRQDPHQYSLLKSELFTPMTEQTYTTREVARMLGVTVQTVQRWVDAGHLRAWRTAGGHRRLSVDSVDAFVRNSKMQLAGTGSEKPASSSQSVVTAWAGQAPRVLIVDDDEGDREIATRIVRGVLPEATIIEADNGFSGLIQLGRQPSNFLLTDVTMPHLDGLAMIRTMSSDPSLSQVRIAAMSSYSSDEIAKRGGLPPGVAFFAKPLDRTAVQAFFAMEHSSGEK